MDGADTGHGDFPRLLACFIAIACAALFIAGRDLDVPGLYYDEVIQAEPAVQFLAEDGRPSQLPGAQTVRLFGGWFPVMIQPYMGALKSQLLMLPFAAFGATATSLRASTLTLGLIGLFFAMTFARATLGTRVAVVAAALIAVDPGFLFISRHDWGSFALGFLCRCAGLSFLVWGWNGRSAWRLFVGGLCFGLGVYNKIDFGVFIAAAGVALLLARPRTLRELSESRGLRALPVAAGFLVGALPVIASLGRVFETIRGAFRRDGVASSDLPEKLDTLVAMLDGSYFHRLMLSGGSFERMFDEPGATGLFLVSFVLFAVAGAGLLWRDQRRGRLDPAVAFVWLATGAIFAGILLTPRAVRIHHILLAVPFPQLVVAVVLVRLWDLPAAAGATLRLGRGVAAAALCAVLLSNLGVDLRTLAAIRESGGKGRWSEGIGAFARELAAQPGSVAVSLDWGFDGPLAYAARDLTRIEPVWTLRSPRRPGHPWQLRGGPGHTYLLFEDDLAVFDYGSSFLAAVRKLDPERVTVRRHLDRQGDVAFLSVRISAPHRLVYDREFEVTLP
jgi:hypothetical protein